ncbi:MAG: hypothetical protein IT160_04725 [Bryobacterales bacterium]|nr:hypothetical protein [Bryobacterales bacterium]
MRCLGIALLAAALSLAAPPEDVYRGELVAYPGAWSFSLGKQGIIVVRDDELVTLAEHPDQPLNLSTGRRARYESLRQICERGQALGQRTLSLAFDQFFAQYRPGQDTPRRLMPDMDEYIRYIAAIGRFAGRYGLGLELSLLSPLEIGKAYAARTGESGLWMHYREGVRDPVTGAFSVELWRHTRWVNNKGPIDVADAGVRVFAFKEKPIGGSTLSVVDPADIVELRGAIEVQRFDHLVRKSGAFHAIRVRVHGRVPLGRQDLDRVVVLQLYRTPEMDYFSPRALPFLTTLIDRYAAAGIRLNALYADEMHIQQDWNYFSHHDHGEFAMRYVSPGLAREYAARYGAQYADLARYMVYFLHGQHDTAIDLTAKRGVQHVFGASPDAIQQTALFRARYYRLLQDGVVDLFVKAKKYAEQKMGRRLETRAHATWAESPTVDYWGAGESNHWRAKYEYTPDFIWSDTVQQSASACDDYFKWGEFLTGNGNDHAEGGWIDRDYFGLALAASTGIINEVPYSYAAHWGHPEPVMRRRTALVDVYGDVAEPAFAAVQESVHRDTGVLMLYPLDLVAVEERFGSWMAQYGYANYITAAKLLELGRVRGGAIEMAGRRFTTLVTLFEPFPRPGLLEMMRDLIRGGGRVVWSGPPPLITFDGRPALPLWSEIFGVSLAPAATAGMRIPAAMVRFEGSLSTVQPQMILSSFLVDRIYPVTPSEGTGTVARVKNLLVGTRRGNAVYLGFRPRDDQSRSLGYDVRTWFEILDAIGAYPGADNPDRISRLGEYMACRFPNGSIAVAPHLREVEEGWQGGFARDPKADRIYMERHPLPPGLLRLRDFKVSGHRVDYDGSHAMAFRVDARKRLVAFAGETCREITVDGVRHVFADSPMDAIAWAPVAAARRIRHGAVFQIRLAGTGTVRIPSPWADLELFVEAERPGSRGARVPHRYENGTLVIQATPQYSGRWIWGVARQTDD